MMNSLVNTGSTQMMGFQGCYNTPANTGHFQQMYNSQQLQTQRPSSFAIHEILGLSPPSCRQSITGSPELFDTQLLGSSQNCNLMYVSGINGGSCANEIQPQIAQQPSPYYREQVPQQPSHHNNGSFPSWRFDSINQCSAPTSVNTTQPLPRYTDAIGYGLKAPSLEDGKKMIGF